MGYQASQSDRRQTAVHRGNGLEKRQYLCNRFPAINTINAAIRSVVSSCLYVSLLILRIITPSRP